MTLQVIRITVVTEMPRDPLAALTEEQARAQARAVGKTVAAQAEALVIEKWEALQAEQRATFPALPMFVAPDGRVVVNPGASGTSHAGGSC